MTQTLLDFDRPSARYPDEPGYYRHAPETSREAATSIAADAVAWKNKVVFALTVFGPLTADEVADRLWAPILTIRPRLSELRRSGHVVDSGLRRRNQSGKRAVVWKLV